MTIYLNLADETFSYPPDRDSGCVDEGDPAMRTEKEFA
jgi:hypothetical protein